jgi:hypothetical protein
MPKNNVNIHIEEIHFIRPENGKETDNICKCSSEAACDESIEECV